MTITQTNQPKGAANMIVASRDFYMKFNIGGRDFFAQSIIAPVDYTIEDAASDFGEASKLDLPVYDPVARKLDAMLKEADIGVTLDQVETAIADNRAARAAASAQTDEGKEGTQGTQGTEEPGGDDGAATPDRPPR